MSSAKQVTTTANKALKSLKDFSSKSSYIRYLTSENLSRAQIVKRFSENDKMYIRYQHVNNVLREDALKKAAQSK